MKIHLVGAYYSNSTWGFERAFGESIKLLGHELIVTDPRMQHNNRKSLVNSDADLMIFCKGDSIDPDILDDIPAYKVLWFPDSMAIEERKSLVLDMGPKMDRVFHYTEADIPFFNSIGIEAKVLPLTFNPNLYKPDPKAKKVKRIAFVGSNSKYRSFVLNKLVDEGLPIYGVQAYGKEAAKIYQTSDVVLNLPMFPEYKGDQSRVFEVLASGGCLVSPLNEHDTNFLEGVDLLSYTDYDSLVETLQNALKDSGMRKQISDNGHEKVMAEHTIENRIQVIIEDYDRNGGIREKPRSEETRHRSTATVG